VFSYANPTVDAALQAIHRSPDQKLGIAKLGAVQQQVAHDVPVFFMLPTLTGNIYRHGISGLSNGLVGLLPADLYLEDTGATQ
jgi:hypothetical protein